MCKMEHFGNCDPETENQEYCIFHKPNKSEDEAREFWEKFFGRFGPKVEKREIDGRKQKVLVFERPINAMGFVFPEMPFQPIEMPGGWKFCNRQHYSECIDFRGAVFDDYANFYRAFFEGEISFENTVFKEDVLFSKAIFKKLVLFNGCSFNGKGNKLPRIYTEIAQVAPFDDILSVIDNTEAEDPENINISTAFIKTVFEETASFFDATFEGSILFDMAEFQKGAIFDKVQFKGFLTSFRGIKVYSSLDKLRFEIGLFSDINYDAYHQEFNSGISFIDADFLSARVKFERAVINLGTHFQKCKFHSEEVNFHKATFNGETRFNDAIFKGDTKFWECKFNGRSEFYSAKFQGKQTSFARSTFREVAHFDFAEFGNAIFNFAVFEKGASFRNATFYDEVWFREVLFESTVEFQDAVFRGDAIFIGSTFERLAIFTRKPDSEPYKFEGRLSFEDCDIYKGIQIDLPRDWFKLSEAFIEAMRIQKLSYERLGRYEDADRVLVSLKREQRKSKNIVIRFLEWLFLDWSSEYFTNPRRILRTSVVVIIVFGFIYWINNCIDFCVFHQLSIAKCLKISSGPICSGGIKHCCTKHFVTDLLNSIYFSMVTFTTLGFGDLAPTGLMKAFAAIEALLGALLIAALVSVGVQRITR